MSGQSRPAIDESVEIAGSPAEVWDVLTDWELADQWLPNVSEVDGAVPTEVGAELPFRYQGQRARAVIDVVRVPEHLVIRRPNGPVEAVFVYDLAPSARGTTVHLRADLAATKGVGVVRWLLRRFLARTDRSQLDRLKVLVESSID